MNHRFVASYYDHLLRGPVVHSPVDMVRLAKILLPVWSRYQTWKLKKDKEKKKRYAMAFIILVMTVLVFRYWPGFQWWVFAHLRLAITVSLASFN